MSGDRIGAIGYGPGLNAEVKPGGGARGALRVLRALREWDAIAHRAATTWSCRCRRHCSARSAWRGPAARSSCSAMASIAMPRPNRRCRCSPRHCDVGAVLLSDPLEHARAAAGTLCACTASSGRVLLDFSAAATRARWAAIVRRTPRSAGSTCCAGARSAARARHARRTGSGVARACSASGGARGGALHESGQPAPPDPYCAISICRRAPGWWPPAPGWWLLAAIVDCCLAFVYLSTRAANIAQRALAPRGLMRGTGSLHRRGARRSVGTRRGAVAVPAPAVAGMTTPATAALAGERWLEHLDTHARQRRIHVRRRPRTDRGAVPSGACTTTRAALIALVRRWTRAVARPAGRACLSGRGHGCCSRCRCRGWSRACCARRRRRPARRLRLPYALEGLDAATGANPVPRWRRLLALLAWCALIVAAARPQWVGDAGRLAAQRPRSAARGRCLGQHEHRRTWRSAAVPSAATARSRPLPAISSSAASAIASA